jgi:type IV secretory pathway TraG/TraD family ATPase VirD4
VTSALFFWYAGLLRQRLQRLRLPVLFAIDEAPAVALGNVADYMATSGGYGVTLLLYAQSVPQLLGVYSQPDVKAILGNCHHQVWYPPQDTETARMISTIFGTRVEIAPSTYESGGSWIPGAGASTRYRPALEDAQAMALPEGTVVAISSGLRFIGQRLDPRPFLQEMSEPVPGVSFDPVQGTALGSGSDTSGTGQRRDLAEEIKRAIESGRADGSDEA